MKNAIEKEKKKKEEAKKRKHDYLDKELENRKNIAARILEKQSKTSKKTVEEIPSFLETTYELTEKEKEKKLEIRKATERKDKEEDIEKMCQNVIYLVSLYQCNLTNDEARNKFFKDGENAKKISSDENLNKKDENLNKKDENLNKKDIKIFDKYFIEKEQLGYKIDRKKIQEIITEFYNKCFGKKRNLKNKKEKTEKEEKMKKEYTKKLREFIISENLDIMQENVKEEKETLEEISIEERNLFKQMTKFEWKGDKDENYSSTELEKIEKIINESLMQETDKRFDIVKELKGNGFYGEVGILSKYIQKLIENKYEDQDNKIAAFKNNIDKISQNRKLKLKII